MSIMDYFNNTKGIRKKKRRPKGRLPQENMLHEMHDNVKEYVKKLKEYPEVEAISLGGGISRGYCDNLSEIDLNVYLSISSLLEWEMGNGPIPHGDHLGDKYHMDISFLSIDQEEKERWSILKKWDASYAKILYDPLGKLENLLESKDEFTSEEKYGVAVKNYLDCVYYGDIVVRQWIKRKDPLTANQILSKGIHSLCNLLFLANNEYLPFEKWLINYSLSLEWKPDDWENRLKQVTLINEISFEEVKRRKTMFEELYHEIWGKIVGEDYREIGLIELEALDILRYIIDEHPTLDVFEEKYGHKQLGYEVLYKLSYLVEVNGILSIQFDEEKFLEEQKNGFSSFLEWNREILSHIRLNQS
jgi:hypothetical protein